MFIDKAEIHIKGGKGGDGCVSFHRAKYIPKGGPDGGDGGDGGSVIFQASGNISTLLDFSHRKYYAADDGENGQNAKKYGKKGADVVIKVPQGTLIIEAKSGKLMADMARPPDRRVIIKGGKGGRGNAHFATPSRQAPEYAEKGREAREYDVLLELKLIADIGIIGLPNAGKSTLLAMATNAKPKIANYHFTTLSPNLGCLRGFERDYILADIPGLIEGASAGAGLGHDFLRHAERTKLFIHVVDAAATEGGDPVEMIRTIRDELRKYNPDLLKRPCIIAANKIDVSTEHIKRIEQTCEPLGIKVFPVSAAGNSGITEIMEYAAELLKDLPFDVTFHENFDRYEYEREYEPREPDAPFTITQTDARRYTVEGENLRKMLGRTNIGSGYGFTFFQRYLRDRGIIDALREAGVRNGDTVVLYDTEFEFMD